MTGFFTWTRGSSFLNESRSAWRRISRSNRPRAVAHAARRRVGRLECA